MASASLCQLVCTAQIPLAYILSTIWLAEKIDVWKFAGILFIFAALIIVIVTDLKEEKKEEEEEEEEERKRRLEGVVEGEGEEGKAEAGRGRSRRMEGLKESGEEQRVEGAIGSDERTPLIDNRVPTN